MDHNAQGEKIILVKAIQEQMIEYKKMLHDTQFSVGWKTEHYERVLEMLENSVTQIEQYLNSKDCEIKNRAERQYLHLYQ